MAAQWTLKIHPYIKYHLKLNKLYLFIADIKNKKKLINNLYILSKINKFKWNICFITLL